MSETAPNIGTSINNSVSYNDIDAADGRMRAVKLRLCVVNIVIATAIVSNAHQANSDCGQESGDCCRNNDHDQEKEDDRYKFPEKSALKHNLTTHLNS